MVLTPDVGFSSKILIVDDNQSNLRLLEKILAHAGYNHLVLESDARFVIQQVLSFEPDLILLDLNMPHLDGFQVLQQIKNQVLSPEPPVMILTAQRDQEFLLRALEAGARDYLSQPFDSAELLMRVRNLLEAHLASKLMLDKNAALESLVNQRTQALVQAQFQAVSKLGMVAEFRDSTTGYHIQRMSQVCAYLAKALSWSSQAQQLILHASPLHDIGKIAIPDSILLKPGKLTAEEWEVMKTHTTIGAKLLDDQTPMMEMAREIALTHHERWDGTGYPRGLAADEIPISGQIAALADVFDALTSVRPYKAAWSSAQAIAYIREQGGLQFSPLLVELLCDELKQIEQILSMWQEKEPSQFTVSKFS